MNTTDLLLDAEKVVQLIPQKAPFVMVDKLIASTDTSSTSGLTITEANIFTQNGTFQEPGLVENIAQTAALRAGYMFSQLADDSIDPPVGFIGAIKNLKIYALPKVGSHLETTITIENQVFDITLVDGKIRCNNELIAECKMKIFVEGSGNQ